MWDETGAYRVIHRRRAEAVYVLHAFQKENPSDIETRPGYRQGRFAQIESR